MMLMSCFQDGVWISSLTADEALKDGVINTNRHQREDGAQPHHVRLPAEAENLSCLATAFGTGVYT